MGKDMDGEEDGVELEGTFVRQTESAELWELHDYGDEEVWIPKSQIVESDEESTLIVTDWFGKKIENEHGDAT